MLFFKLKVNAAAAIVAGVARYFDNVPKVIVVSLTVQRVFWKY